jgi:hypothetical protein
VDGDGSRDGLAASVQGGEMTTLLDKARTARSGDARRKHDKDETLDLALAYSRNEVSAYQAAQALGKNGSGNSISCLGCRLLSAVRQGDIEVKDLRQGRKGKGKP